MIRLVALDIDGTLLAPGVHFEALPEDPITRACTLNLVVVAEDGSEGLKAATNLVARVSETEPGRAVVVAFPEDDTTRDGL